MNALKPTTVKALVREVLEQRHDHEWTVQGLGMLRTYLTADRSARLHIWDDRLQVAEASPIHTHPWDMVSTVVAGAIQNTRLLEIEGEPTHLRQLLKCGEGGGLCGGPEQVALFAKPFEHIAEVSSYTQRADEIHISKSERGTVTIVEREFGSDVDHAYVYWSLGTAWGSAEPRSARTPEVDTVCRYALETWFA